MTSFYQKFLKTKIDLAPLGAAHRTENEPYFCTPKGASIFGWAGVDGIHFCFVRGFGEMVFAVSPMNGAPDYVHPIARDFRDFLRLLLACGDTACLEQAWQWNDAQFHAFLQENPPTTEQKTVLAELADKLKLAPMEAPWQYLHTLQSDFDYSTIKYTEELDDVPAAPSFPEWKVYFDGNFWGHHGRARAGTELKLNQCFQWAGHRWLVPSVYLCSRGLVVDLCMQTEAEDIRAWMEKWNLTPENDDCERFTPEQQRQLMHENPLHLEFTPQLTLNGKLLSTTHGCGICYNPCLPDLCDALESSQAIAHYGLDPSCGWSIRRAAFPWGRSRRPELKSITLTMHPLPEEIPGPRFRVHAPGDRFTFAHPTSGTEYTLTVQELERQTMPERQFGSNRWHYPTHFTAMSYVLSPEPDRQITVSDCANSDQPVEKAPSTDPLAPTAGSSVACIGIIGGADGPTAIRFGGCKQGTLCAACSALHFQPVDEIEWRITFHETSWESACFPLL